MEGFLFCIPPRSGNSSLASYFASKILTFNTPLPLGISKDLPWGGHGYFLELHINNMIDIKIICHYIDFNLNFSMELKSFLSNIHPVSQTCSIKEKIFSAVSDRVEPRQELP